MEQGALLIVFLCTWLLICKFHIQKSWRIHRNKDLKGNSPLYVDIKNQLCWVEDQLIHTLSLENDHAIITDDATVLEEVKKQSHAAIAEKALMHLNSYLLGY
jgi:hypothetical protein